MAEKMTMPRKKETAVDEDAPQGQKAPALKRYRLQVDRQMKQTYDDKEAAEKFGREIKKKFPVVQVTIYDAQTEERVIL
jgi:hypothetical protein